MTNVWKKIKVFVSATQFDGTKSLPNAGMKHTAAKHWSKSPPIQYAEGGKVGKGAGKGTLQRVSSTKSLHVGGIPHGEDETMVQRIFEYFQSLLQPPTRLRRQKGGQLRLPSSATSETCCMSMQGRRSITTLGQGDVDPCA